MTKLNSQDTTIRINDDDIEIYNLLDKWFNKTMSTQNLNWVEACELLINYRFSKDKKELAMYEGFCYMDDSAYYALKRKYENAR